MGVAFLPLQKRDIWERPQVAMRAEVGRLLLVKLAQFSLLCCDITLSTPFHRSLMLEGPHLILVGISSRPVVATVSGYL